MELILLAIAAGAAIIGAGVSIGGAIGQADIASQELTLQQNNADIQNAATLTGLQNDAALMGIQLTEAEANLSAYEQALSNFPAYAQLQKDLALETGRSNYNQLLGNYENTAAVMAATGRTSGSGAIVTNNEKMNLERFAGSDLKFNTTGGGIFAQQYQQLVTDLNTEQQSIKDQIDIFQDTINILSGPEGAIATTEQAIADIEAIMNPESTWYGFKPGEGA